MVNNEALIHRNNLIYSVQNSRVFPETQWGFFVHSEPSMFKGFTGQDQNTKTFAGWGVDFITEWFSFNFAVSRWIPGTDSHSLGRLSGRSCLYVMPLQNSLSKLKAKCQHSVEECNSNVSVL